ncbi:MAG TPA: hypothetical protein VJM76_00245 [Gammaproteobacteria bacterium]|nr:hypothetical protein [Gammaproteobacteria bacterium]
MADNIEFTFSHRQVIEALLVKKGITEGKWALIVQFGFNAITAGPSDDELFPTAMVGVTSIGIRRAEEGTKGVIVDATLFAPRRKTTKKIAASRVKTSKTVSKK